MPVAGNTWPYRSARYSQGMVPPQVRGTFGGLSGQTIKSTWIPRSVCRRIFCFQNMKTLSCFVILTSLAASTIVRADGADRPVYMDVVNLISDTFHAGPPISIHGKCNNMTETTIAKGQTSRLYCQEIDPVFGPGPEGTLTMKSPNGTCILSWHHPFGAGASTYSCDCYINNVGKIKNPLFI